MEEKRPSYAVGYGLLVLCLIIGAFKINSFTTDNDPTPSPTIAKEADELPKEYLGPISGIQASYGAVISDRVTSTQIGIAPESVFTFCFATSGRVVLQRHMVMQEGPEEYWCKGTYEILETNEESLTVKCSLNCLEYGRDKHYILKFQKDGKSATFHDPSDSEAPSFTLKRQSFSCE